MKSLYDFIKETESDYDVYDNVFNTSVTVCYIDDDTDDDYDRFCIDIIKKVNVVEHLDDCTLVADWSKLIKRNMDKFKEFTNKYWNNKYEHNEDEFIYQWINEIQTKL